VDQQVHRILPRRRARPGHDVHDAAALTALGVVQVLGQSELWVATAQRVGGNVLSNPYATIEVRPTENRVVRIRPAGTSAGARRPRDADSSRRPLTR
jgi:hypothetical protein